MDLETALIQLAIAEAALEPIGDLTAAWTARESIRRARKALVGDDAGSGGSGAVEVQPDGGPA